MAIEYPYCKPEIWGGIECSITRVGNNFRNQLLETGHHTRKDDIEQFAALGIRKLRYPVLWEYHQPADHSNIDWSETTERLNLIRSRGMEPIAGLLHHGSGPAYTDLIDPGFPQKLADYAAKVATRFPWLRYYTPVNEPLTTARFSGLYGLWYPHHKSELSFIKMLLNQLKGTVLAMQAIRKINPFAELIQTEDLSKTHSTPLLSYQALFENKRRWLTYDLLCRKVTKKHFFWNYFIEAGIDKSELMFFLDNPCPPAVIGCNYYVTSERYLDERIDQYPAWTHGGNGKHIYADTEAVRANRAEGLESLLIETWHRYQLPLAITECHLGCTREEQLRWLKETWDTCCQLNKKNIPFKAVTAWSLLGAYDWNSLLTQHNNDYEPGVFDIRNNHRRPTALSKLLYALSANGNYDHPLLQGKGWWHQPATKNMKNSKASPVLITGRNGTLGQAFIKTCERRSIPYIALPRTELDITNEQHIQRAIETYKPWAVINAAGYVKVDEAEINCTECIAANTTGPGLLATACTQYGIQLLTFSSDLVFDGTKTSPYDENDPVNPLNIYGASKVDGESRVQSAHPGSLIIRSSAFFGPWDRYNFVYAILQSLKNNETVHVAGDVMISPTYVPDLVNMAMDLFIDEEQGIWHISNKGMLSWADFAQEIAERGGYSINKLSRKPLAEMGWKAKRPLYSVLESKKGIELPALEHALGRYFEEQMV